MITIANANALHIPLPDESVQSIIASKYPWEMRSNSAPAWDDSGAELEELKDTTQDVKQKES